jgi:hypothetical protein
MMNAKIPLALLFLAAPVLSQPVLSQPVLNQAVLSQAEPLAFDALLNGVEEKCRYSPKLHYLLSNLSQLGDEALTAESGALTPAQYFPEALREAIRESGIEHDKDRRTIRIRVDGTWQGVGLEALIYVHGIDTGIQVLAIEFSGPVENVLTLFLDKAFQSARDLAANPDSEFEVSTGLSYSSGRLRYYCDLSV